jgi:excisionase family DNA binding protein
MPAPVALLTTAEAAAYLGVAPSTLAHWRSAGDPHPPAVKLGRRALRYRLQDLENWLEAQVEQQAAA